MIRKTPSISVILPVYNAAATLTHAILSLLSQTEKNFELIIIDDGSNDGSSSVIKNFAENDSRIKPVRTEHNGIVHALNLGLRNANGTYIARMDADDIALPDRLALQQQFLDEHGDVGLVSCLVEHLGDNGNKAGYARHVQWVNSLVHHRAIAINRFIESPLAHPSVMFRKKLVDRFGGYRPGPFPEDYELWLRWLEQGIRMEKIPKVLLKWRDKPDRLSRTHPRYSFEAFYRIKAEYLARWLEENNPVHPEVVIWGAGRPTRKRAEMLTDHGVSITHYIDVDPRKIGTELQRRPVWGPGHIPAPGRHFIVSYVGARGANEQIRLELEQKGYREGLDFIFAA